MNDIKKLKQKLKKISFKRVDSHKVKSLKEAWRKPKRRSSRARLELKGKIKLVKVGYRTPKALRNKTFDGKEIVYVNSISQLSSLDQKKHVLVVANLGKKKKIELLKKIIELKFEVLNYDPQLKLKELEESFKSKVEKRKEFESEREKKLAESQEKEKKSSVKEDTKKADTKKEEAKKEEKGDTKVKNGDKNKEEKNKNEKKSEKKKDGNKIKEIEKKDKKVVSKVSSKKSTSKSNKENQKSNKKE